MRQPLMRRHLISMPSLLEDYSDVTTANIKNISPPSFSGESFTPSNGSLVYHTITSRDMDYIRQPESNAIEHTYKDTSTPFPPLLMPQQGPPRRGLFNFLFRRQKGKKNASSSRSLWRPRHARSAEEGIRREPELLLAEERDKGSGSDQPNTLNRKSSARRLSSVLAKASVSIEKTSRRMAARTLTGLITALAEEVVDLDVEVDARDDTPYYNKHITAVRIRFARLGFKPLRIGGHDTAQSRRPPSLDDNQSLLLNSFRRRSALDQKLMGVSTWNDDDEYDEVIEQRNGELLSKPPMTADEAFDHIDADKSGYLDRNELVQALTLAARSNVDNVQLQEEIESESNLPILEKLASDLFELYDINGDGVVDRKEYKTMVEDMAALRKAQHLREQKRKAHASDDGRGDRDIASRWSDAAMEFVHNNTGFINSGIEFVQNKTSFLSTGMEFVQNKSEFLTSGLNFVQGYAGWLPWRSVEPNESTLNASSTKSHDVDSARTSDGAVQVVDSPELVESMSKSLGSITFSDVKMDLRRLFFGAIPILKHIVPGGPLILEPFTTTITGSFDRYDIMNSVLLDAGLRRLVMRALRRRVGFLRDFLEGAMFKGRSWKTYNGEGPRVDIPELTNVEFDSNDKLIITGRARVKTSPDSPVIEQSFKVRTSIGTRKDGRFIRLEKPELALVIECPKVWDANLEQICKALGIRKPPRLKPIYTFFPIYSPFKLEEDDGFDLGLDNSITSLFIQNGKLRFEMKAVLRPGRFLGSHYIAFTIPIRTFIVTLDRVTEGIRSARKGKKAAKALKMASERILGDEQTKQRRKFSFDTAEDVLSARQEGRMKSAAASRKSNVRSFFSRFVDGYLQAERDDTKKERLTAAIRDFFGRQGS